MWDYAKLSKLAYRYGGPEKLVNYLVNIGIKKGRHQMIPANIIFLITGLITGLALRSLIDHLRRKAAQSESALEDAKAELIQGIKDYDELHPQSDK